MLRITMIGAGYVGLVTSACLASLGHEVIAIESDPARFNSLKAGKVPFFEPGLDALVQSTLASGHLSIRQNLGLCEAEADIIFIAVGTPPRVSDGHADLRQIFVAARQIAASARTNTVIAVKSTVPVGTGDEIEHAMRLDQPNKSFHLVSNPEFLREGAAIKDFMQPDRIVVGTSDPDAAAVMRSLFDPLISQPERLLVTSRRSAEMIKYASNAFLATKVTFINEMADLCEAIGADVGAVADGMGLDSRIGRKFLDAGPGFGGSCFPKDTSALLKTAQDAGVPLRIVETLVAVNESRRRAMARKVIKLAGGSVRDKVIGVLGLTFKPNTDDMREAPSIPLITALQDAGARVRVYDPQGMERAKQHLVDVDYAGDASECLRAADLGVLVTDWAEFRTLTPQRIASLLRSKCFADLRNIYDAAAMKAAGIDYFCIGRKPAQAIKSQPSANSPRLRQQSRAALPLLDLAAGRM